MSGPTGPLGGRAVVVTGAGRGMGAGVVEALLDAGASVALIDIVPGSCEAVAARLGAAVGAERVVACTGDVSIDVDIERVLALAVDRFGRLDGWVNGAGIIEMAPSIDDTRDNFEAHLRVNLTAVLRCCQVAAKWWRAQGVPGSIVNVASYAAKVGYFDMIGYNASKAGVVNITRNLAKEWARHRINVNCICPSGVDTPMLDAVASYIGARDGVDVAGVRAGMVAGDLGRCIAPIEIGRVVAFLLSDDALVIRGQAISVDGGDSPY
jgi:NAD(P)-dependent dehydrogenase (short-subunit alcohol dehydrogenase family)